MFLIIIQKWDSTGKTDSPLSPAFAKSSLAILRLVGIETKGRWAFTGVLHECLQSVECVFAGSRQSVAKSIIAHGNQQSPEFGPRPSNNASPVKKNFP